MFLESIESLFCPNAPEPSQWIQQILHNSYSESGENNGPQEDKGEIVGSTAIHASFGVIVGHVEKLVGPASGAGKENVCQGEESEEVDGYAWSKSALKGATGVLRCWGRDIPI